MTSPQNPIAYCLLCIADDGEETLHIFSSAERRATWANQDGDRSHVSYDYEVNNPDAFEKPRPRVN